MKGKPIFTITSAEFNKGRWVFDENCTRFEDVDGDRLVLTPNIDFVISDKNAYEGKYYDIWKYDEIGHYNFKNEII